MNLTPRQREILEYIRHYIQKCRVAPTVNEIRDHFRLNSTATVHKHLKALESRGVIHRSRQKARAIELLSSPMTSNFEIPLLGAIAAGQPIAALETPDTLAIPEDMLGHSETYALRVQGNSMIDDGINDGDYVIIESRSDARDGEIVVALIHDDEATIKRFFREGGRIRLQPSNSTMSPMIYSGSEIQIRGVVIGLIRKYKSF